jgi:pyrroloquinoline quinone (PQQ) biosynthesis protein C
MKIISIKYKFQSHVKVNFVVRGGNLKMSTRQFLDDLHTELPRHQSLNNNFYDYFISTTLSENQMSLFCRQWSYWVYHLPKMICALAARVTDDNVFCEISTTLYEELGSDNPEKAHWKMFNKVAYGYGLTDQQISAVPLLPETHSLVEGMYNLYANEPELVGLGAAFAVEGWALHNLSHQYEGYRKYNLSHSDLEYYYVHLICEYDHANGYKDILSKALDNAFMDATNKSLFLEGYNTNLNLFVGFWNGVYRSLLAREN